MAKPSPRDYQARRREVHHLGEDPLTPLPPVHLFSRVVEGVFDDCRRAVPDEALGKIFGYRREWKGRRYVRVTDWSTAPCDRGPAHARFDGESTRLCQQRIDERHGWRVDRPREVGVYHSHPFDAEPHLSSIDRETFLSFPYDTPGNVFLLIDPISGHFKAYVVESTSGGAELRPVAWIEYRLRRTEIER